MMITHFKKCSKCKSDKDDSLFYSDRTCKGGKSTVCIECHSKYKNKNRTERDLINDAELVIEICSN